MREHEEPQGNVPSDEQLEWIGEEYLKLAPRLGVEMELGDWEAYRKRLLAALRTRRRQDGSFARTASQLNALMHARGEALEHLHWPEAIGRRAYASLYLRLQLYRADLAIANIKTHGEKRRWQSYDRMEGGAFAAFEEMRQVTVKRMREDEDDPLVEALGAGGSPHIVKPEGR